MTVDSLKVSKLGKLVVKLVKEPPSSGELIFISPRRRRTRPRAPASFIAPVELEMNRHPFRINATDAERHVLQYMYLTSFSILRCLSQTQLSRTWLPMWNENGAHWLVVPKGR